MSPRLGWWPEVLKKQEIEKDSPTCTSESLKMILSIIAQNEWVPNPMDVKTAFLQGDLLDRQVFLRPPKEANQIGKLWHLNKCVYGLSDASLKWYQRVKNFLLSTDGNMSKVDPAVFCWHNGDRCLSGVLACHVDDFLWGGHCRI